MALNAFLNNLFGMEFQQILINKVVQVNIITNICRAAPFLGGSFAIAGDRIYLVLISDVSLAFQHDIACYQKTMNISSH